MVKIKKILAPTDLSELSRVGVRYALEMAQSQRAEVTVYYVADYNEALPSPLRSYRESSATGIHVQTVEEFEKQRENQLARFLEENFTELISKVTVHRVIEIGVAHKRIVEKAAKEEVDMIVMSTHGTTGILHLLIGSVTEQVVRRSTCPVLCIRPETKQ